MGENNLTVCIEVSAKMAKDLYQRLIIYKKISLEPESTQSIPDLNLMCILAEDLLHRLESKQ